MAALIAELREAREQVARLAANEERLRLARDLHDLTGHSLSMITLKAELAQRLVGRAAEAAETLRAIEVGEVGEVGETPQTVQAAGPAADPATVSRLTGALTAALTEIADIEQVSRQTLTDIREAVSGYRRATFAVELASACAALDAAGMKLDADPAVVAASGKGNPEIESVLAWCLREAVTNVIRHSGATLVRIRLAETDGELALTVWNNGRGLAETVGTTAKTAAIGGNGLAGLRERLDLVGGRLAIGGTDGDFRLVAAVPMVPMNAPALL
jgi:two-component system sensor histidine kinase DesK